MICVLKLYIFIFESADIFLNSLKYYIVKFGIPYKIILLVRLNAKVLLLYLKGGETFKKNKCFTIWYFFSQCIKINIIDCRLMAERKIVKCHSSILQHRMNVDGECH